MTENLFLTNRHYEDGGDFAQRYFYQLRGRVPPPIKSERNKEDLPNKNTTERKSRRQASMDAARKKVNKRFKRT